MKFEMCRLWGQGMDLGESTSLTPALARASRAPAPAPTLGTYDLWVSQELIIRYEGLRVYTIIAEFGVSLVGKRLFSVGVKTVS
jgi:hypothetical protein